MVSIVGTDLGGMVKEKDMKMKFWMLTFLILRGGFVFGNSQSRKAENTEVNNW
jgi:hypothetical protein